MCRFLSLVCDYWRLCNCNSASYNKSVAEVLRHKREVLGELCIIREQFDVIFDSVVVVVVVVVEAKCMDHDELQLWHKRHMPARIDYGREEQFQLSDVISLHRAQFYEAVDVLVSAIDWHLGKQSLQQASTFEQLLTNASHRLCCTSWLPEFCHTYRQHLDSQKLMGKLLLLAEYNIGPTIADIICGSRKLIFISRLMPLSMML